MKTTLLTTIACESSTPPPESMTDIGRMIARRAGEVEILRVSGSDQFLVVFRSFTLSQELRKRRQILEVLEEMRPRLLCLQWVDGGDTDRALPRKRSNKFRA
jgi:hypothetical protein